MDKEEEIQEYKTDFTNKTKMSEGNNEYCGNNNNNAESTNGTLESVPPHPTINDFIETIRKLQIITPEAKHNDESREKPQNNYVNTEEMKQSKKNSKYAFTDDQTSAPQYVFGHPAVTLQSLYVFGGQKTLGSINNKKIISQRKFESSQATMKFTFEDTVSAKSLFHKTARMSSLYCSRKFETSRTRKKSVKFSALLNSPTASITFKTVIPTFCTAQQNDTSLYVFGDQKKSTSQCIFSTPSATTNSTPEKSASAESLINKTVLMSLFDGTLNFGRTATPTPKFPLAHSTVISFPFSGLFTREARPSYELQKIKIDLYKYEDYKSAIAMFEDAIQLCPDHVPFYVIKCHYYMKLGMYKEAVKDAQKIIEYDSESTYGVICLAKCYIALGYIPGVEEAMSKFHATKSSTDDMQSALQELEQLFELYINIQRATSLDDYTGALAFTDRFLELCPSTKVKAAKSTCLAMLGQFEQALEIAEECLLTDVAEPDALNAKGLCYYYNGQFAPAVDYFKQVLALCPSHCGAIASLKKTNKFMSLSNEGAEALKQCDYSKVIRLNNALLTEKLNIKTNLKLYCSNAAMYLKLNKIQLAIEACTAALRITENCVDALRMRAKCYNKLGKYEDAVNDLENVTDISRSVSNDLEGAQILALNKEQIIMVSDVERLVECQKYKEALKLADDYLQKHKYHTELLYTKGICFYSMGEYEKAHENFLQVLNIEPKHGKALLQFKKTISLKRALESGHELFNSGRWQEALYEFKKALEIDIGNLNLIIKVYCKNAEIYLQLNRISAAINEYEHVLTFDSNCVEALLKRAKCYTEVERYESAIMDYEKISTIVDSEETKQSVRNSVITLKQKIAFREEKKYAEMLLQSQTIENLKLALKLAEESLQVDSSDTNALCVKAMCLYFKGEYDEALDQFQRLLLLKPSHSMALEKTKIIPPLKSSIERANNSVLTGQWQDALDHFSEALTMDMCNKNLRVRLFCEVAAMHSKLNQRFRAVEAYSNALTLDEKCVDALCGRAKCYTEDQRYESAIEDYEIISTIVENDEIKESARSSLRTLKDLLLYLKKSQHAETLVRSEKTEDLELALKLAEECLQFDSSDTNALCVKGQCLYYKEQYQEAINQFLEILNLNPSHKTALKTSKDLIWLQKAIQKGNDLFVSGRWEVALHRFTKGLTLFSNNNSISSKLHYQKATIYWKLGKTHQAIEAYSAAIKLETTSPSALRGRAQCYTEVESYEDAVGDYKKIYNMSQDKQMKQWALNCIETLKKKIGYREKIEYAESLVLSQEFEKLEQGIKLAEECLQFDSSYQRALCVKGCCLYYMDKYDQALDQFQQVMLIKPSHLLALKETEKIIALQIRIQKADDALITERWQDALVNLNAAVNIDKDNKNLKVKLYCKIGNAYFNLNQKLNAIKAYTDALLCDKNCINALRGRAKCFPDVGKYHDALRDYEKLHEIEQSDETKNYLDQAKSAYLYFTFIKGKIEAGNTFLEQDKFRDALSMYKEAAECNPGKTEHYYNKFTLNIAKCYIGLGELSAAELAIIKAREAGMDCADDQLVLESLQRHHAQAQKYIDEQSYDRAISSIDKCLVSSPLSSKAKLIKAECLVKLGKNDQALKIADECIRSDHSDIDAVFVKGICLYYNGNLEQALIYFKEVLRLSPDHAQASAIYKKAKFLSEKKIKGNDEFKKGQWHKALRLYEEALKIDATQIKVNSKLHFNRAAVYVKLNQTHEAAEACIKSLELDENYVKALTLHAKCFTKLKDYDSAVEDYEHLRKIEPSDEIERLLHEAKLSQKKESQNKNYYHILGIDRSATKSDMIQAYKKLAMTHHPDRHVDRSEFERKRQKRRFQLVSEAYNVLSDPKRRHKYDTYED